jgi:hypothetical protein
MSNQQSQNNETKALTAEQQERFRFCDLKHPVMQQLINFQLKSNMPLQQDLD